MAAAAAETLQHTYHLVDDYDQLYASARQSVRSQARALIEERRGQVPGREEQLPIDALSTAHNVNQVRRLLGGQSEKYQEAYNGLVLDCQRLVGEWYRKNTWEYFPKSRHYFDKKTGEFFSHGLSIRQMTENALVPIEGDPEEEARRVNERVEDETLTIVQKLGGIALGGMKIRTISECTDKAIRDYEFDQKRGEHTGYGGYVPEIQKLMIRDITIDEETGDRIEEQVGIPGVYVTHEVIQEALRRLGVSDAKTMDKTTLHGSQMFVSDDILDFVSHLDSVASEVYGQDFFMGELTDNSTGADYNNVQNESAQRQALLRDVAVEVAQFLLFLDERGTDRREAPAIVEDFVKKKLLHLAKDDYQAALHMFDRDTADGLGHYAYLERMGHVDAAAQLWQQIEKGAPGGGYCGAGSCGLENVTATNDLKEKLGYESGDSILKDTERKCKCGSKSIVYAFNAKKVNKYCTACGSYESKATKNGQ